MLFLIRASGVVAALTIALPALAQQGPILKKHAARISSPAESVTAGYLKYCGARFVCYTGIPLDCTPDTRPYQNIAEHKCYCLRDNCPSGLDSLRPIGVRWVKLPGTASVICNGVAQFFAHAMAPRARDA